MFERHFALRENPFPAGHQLRFLYPSREHQEARAHLRYGIENREPFVLITGEVGTGKTTALYDALAEWGNQVQVALITNSALTRQELLEEIALRFGVSLPPGSSKPQALAALERYLHAVRGRGQWAVLLLDEAQNLAMDLLEEIRLLSNAEVEGEKLLQIFLVGQPELELKLSRPELRQLRQRITVHYRLNPLSPEETAGYIHHRISVAGGNAWVIFPPDACREVYRITHGIPREINTVASSALLAAYTENAPSVLPQHVASVSHESEFRSVLSDAAATPLAPEPPRAAPAPPPAPRPAPPVATPPPVAAPTPPPAPPAPASAPVTAREVAPPPAPEPTPAWSPPALEPKTSFDPPSVERIRPEEIDAWSVAARELMAARRRTPEPLAPAPPVAPPPAAPPPPPAPVAPPVASAIAQAAARTSFPTPDELAARPAPNPDVAPDYAHLPPSIREKLEAADAEERARKRGPSPVLLTVGAIVVAAVVVGFLLMQRFGGSHANAADTPAKPATESVSPAASTPPSATPEPATPTITAPLDTATAKPAPQPAAVTPPAPAATKPAAASTPPVAAATPAPQDSIAWGIVVAQYMNEDRAKAERDRLTAATQLPGRLLTYRDSGVQMYRLVLGKFRSESAAETRAGALLSTGAVEQASVVSLGRTR